MSFSRSRFADKLQELVSKRREEAGLYNEIADYLPLVDTGRLLDVGTGAGLQLREIGQRKPELELYCLDISARAIEIAKRYFDPALVDQALPKDAGLPSSTAMAELYQEALATGRRP